MAVYWHLLRNTRTSPVLSPLCTHTHALLAIEQSALQHDEAGRSQRGSIAHKSSCSCFLVVVVVVVPLLQLLQLERGGMGSAPSRVSHAR